MNLHCPHGAKLLTAKAFDAPLAVDPWNPILHHDDVCGADLRAFFASDTGIFTRFASIGTLLLIAAHIGNRRLLGQHGDDLLRAGLRTKTASKTA